MKLHLPVRLFKSVLACLAAVASFSLGSGVAWAEAQNLTFSGSSLIWDTRAENKSFVDEEDAAASFAAGDNVSFTGESTVTLGENITAGTLDIAAGADVTIDLGNYTLNADAISLSGTLNVGDSLSIASGSTLAVQNDAAVLDSALVLGEKSGLVVESAASLNNNALTLQGGSTLILTAAGDGKTYTLLTGISSLLDKNGDTLTAGSYSVNDYFDTTRPGSGFWAGAILQLTDAGTLQLVLHNETVKEAITITSRQTYPSAYQYYAGVSFENISYSSSYAEGGAIYGGYFSTITLSDNGNVEFSGNTATGANYARGGAIDGNVTMTGNGSVSFSGNTASSTSSDYYAEGGAIYGSVTMTGNGAVSFSGNTASSSDSTASGGAIYWYGSSTITLSDNGSVEFSGNKAISLSGSSFDYAYGGAIYGDVTMAGNGDITFSGNTATGANYASGGAIYGAVTLTDNGNIEFSGNTAISDSSHAWGGAIYGDVTMAGNGDITFSGNTATGSSNAYGGAIYGFNTITLSNNGSVTFSGNTASGSSTRGGAIYGDSNSTITLSDNGSVEFSGNKAISDSHYAEGGAIYGFSDSTITLSNNGSVTFSGNTASGSIDARGGAIYTQGDLSIRNNDSVEFYQNAEVANGNTYRLRSIYAYGGSDDEISLSAAAGKSITFYDSVYIGSDATVNLNQDYAYQAENGSYVTIRQQGDIIFTGKYTEQHLNDLLEAAGAGRTATAQEILNSRTTEVCAMTNLYGGRLRVEEGAIYQGQGITAMEGSAATVRVQNAELNHVGYALEFNAGTTLEVAGNSTIRGNVSLLADSLFKLEQAATLSLHETLQADDAELTVQGTALLAGSSTLNASLTLEDGATLEMTGLEAGAVTLSGALTFGGQVDLGENLLASVEALGYGEMLNLFTGVSAVTVGTDELGSARVQAGTVFSNVDNENVYVEFRMSGNVGSLLVVNIPEPTTATLSLLALAGLASRRRRK